MTTTREVEYTVEGARMVGILARPDGVGKRPAILIAHEGNGLDDYQKARAERFAELGQWPCHCARFITAMGCHSMTAIS